MPGLSSVQGNWAGLGQTEPLWSILSDRDKQGGKWDVDEFITSGTAGVGRVLDRVRSLVLNVNFEGSRARLRLRCESTDAGFAGPIRCIQEADLYQALSADRPRVAVASPMAEVSRGRLGFVTAVTVDANL